MVSETLQKSDLVDRESKVDLQKQGDKLPHQILNGRCGKSGSNRSSGRPCLGDNCGQDNTGIASYRDVPSSVNIDMQPDILRVSKNMVSLVSANYSYHAMLLCLLTSL